MFLGLFVIFVMRDKGTTLDHFMKKYIYPILALAILLALPWLFNHVNPYVSFVVTIVLMIYVVDRIIKFLK